MQAFGLYGLMPPQMAVGSMSPNWASVVHHGMNKLVIQHQSIPDG
jgi:hypothetical protein